MRTQCAAALVVAAMIGLVHPVAQEQQAAKSIRVPPDFKRFKDLTDAWAPPWVYLAHGAQVSAVRSFHNAAGQKPQGLIPLRLDDGSTAVLRVLPDPKRETDYEDFKIQVANARGVTIMSTDLYTSYAELDITPIDLVDGPGDELIVVQIKTHSSPPSGHFMSVWKLGQKEPARILADQEVSNIFGTQFIGCARWKRPIVVNLSEPKPRSLRLRPQFGADALSGVNYECRLDPNELAELRKTRRIRFNGTRYALSN